jgi:hypothetical protein
MIDTSFIFSEIIARYNTMFESKNNDQCYTINRIFTYIFY